MHSRTDNPGRPGADAGRVFRRQRDTAPSATRPCNCAARGLLTAQARAPIGAVTQGDRRGWPAGRPAPGRAFRRRLGARPGACTRPTTGRVLFALETRRIQQPELALGPIPTYRLASGAASSGALSWGLRWLRHHSGSREVGMNTYSGTTPVKVSRTITSYPLAPDADCSGQDPHRAFSCSGFGSLAGPRSLPGHR